MFRSCIKNCSAGWRCEDITHFTQHFHSTKSRLSPFLLQLIASRFFKSKNVVQKSSDIDVVTETDQEVEKLLIDTLTSAFPHHRYLLQYYTIDDKVTANFTIFA